MDTCGTCCKEHQTSECNSKDKTYCISCKSEEHASWERSCPEFRRHCTQFDKKFLEDDLPYFPMNEEWKLAT